MTVIEGFIKEYSGEFEYYRKLSQTIASEIEDQLFLRGIKAIVTYRAKRPDRLRDKLVKRNMEKKYSTTEEIYADIIDLAGIRVSLYFPSEREVIDEVITDLFDVVKTKRFPNEAHTPQHGKRFSGYWATHYRVKLKATARSKRLGSNKKDVQTIAEIQVASVLMHSWSEVEHDLVYKPFSGNLSREELAILDEINGLVLSGEIALERLRFAMSERTKKQNEIKDKYELTNYLLSNLDQEYLSKIKLGDTHLLDNFINTIKKLDIGELNGYIEKVNINLPESVTDQILSMLMTEILDEKKGSFKDYFKNLHIAERKISDFERFVKCWSILEMAVKAILRDDLPPSGKYLIPDFAVLKSRKLLSLKETEELRKLRQIRNLLLHGLETPGEEYLRNAYRKLKTIAAKIIDSIPVGESKQQLSKNLESL